MANLRNLMHWWNTACHEIILQCCNPQGLKIGGFFPTSANQQGRSKDVLKLSNTTSFVKKMKHS